MGNFILRFAFIPATICFFFLTPVSNAQAQHKYNSLLWQISGNGLQKPSYLYGTMHVSNKIAFNLTDSFFIALNNCDIIALEINPNTWLEGMINSDLFTMALSMLPQKSHGDNFYESAFHIDVPDQKMIAAALAEDPKLVNELLFRFKDNSVNSEENTFLDLFIFQSGTKLGKSITSLEDFNSMFLKVSKAMMPDVDEKSLSSRSSRREAWLKNGDTPLELVEKAYRANDLDMLDSLTDLVLPSANARKYLLDERNIDMVHTMDSIMKIKSLFAGMGAMHLPGDSGIIELLRMKGYVVKPVYSKINNSSISQRQKLEETYFPVSFREQYVSDSTFSVEVPGKLSELPQYLRLEIDLLCADMVNSAYYTISRRKTFGGLTGKKPSDVLRQLDSMMYENIPGKITRKNSITSNNGMPGFDITSKTRRGDILRYQIFVSPIEIFIFRMGGNGDYALGKDGDRFFSSIRFRQVAASQPGIASPRMGGFAVKIPAYKSVEENAPSKSTVDFSKPSKDVIMQAYEMNSNAFYLAMASSLQDFDFIEEDTFELSHLMKNFANQFHFQTIHQSFGTTDRCPSLSSKMKNATGEELSAKIIIKGPHYYLLCVNGSEAEADQFISSFTFVDFNYPAPFPSYRDTSMNFSVNTSTVNQKINSYAHYFNDMINLYMKDKGDKTDLSYRSDNKTETYVSAMSPEAIQVKRNKHHLFYKAEDKTIFWNNEVDDLTMNSGLVVKQRTMSMRDTMPVLNMLLVDTNSAQALKVMMILQGRSLYTLTASIDTTHQPSEWMKQFFSSFMPADSLCGASIFSSKSALFFDYLNSDDTVLQEQAMSSVVIMQFENSDAARMITYINSDNFRKKNTYQRANFISELGRLHQKDVLPFLRKIYMEYGDTVSMQLAVLEALAQHHSSEASRLFIELLKIETPLSSDEFSIQNIFTPFYDSLEMAKPLFPSLFDYTSFPEYKTPVYNLLATMSWKKIIPASFYASKKSLLQTEANAELKRELAAFADHEDNYHYDYDDYGDYDDEESSYGELERQSLFTLGTYYGYRYEYQTTLNKRDEFTGPWNDLVMSYIVLLLPFYNEAPVKTYFDKILKSNNDELVLKTTFLLIKSGMNTDGSALKKYLAKDEWRLFILEQLDKYHHTELFDTSYNNQLSMSRGYVLGDYYGSSDTILFVTKKWAANRFGSGYVYFFKTKDTDDENWKLHYTGFQPQDSTQYTSQPLFFYHTMKKYSNTNLNDGVDDAITDIQNAGRKRMLGNYLSSLHNYDYDSEY